MGSHVDVALSLQARVPGEIAASPPSLRVVRAGSNQPSHARPTSFSASGHCSGACEPVAFAGACCQSDAWDPARFTAWPTERGAISASRRPWARSVKGASSRPPAPSPGGRFTRWLLQLQRGRHPWDGIPPGSDAARCAAAVVRRLGTVHLRLRAMHQQWYEARLLLGTPQHRHSGASGVG
jgi:hypothetical protein